MKMPEFEGFFGQRKIVRFLKRTAEGALAKGETFSHTLLKGGSGLGKTELGKAIARKISTQFHLVVCTREFKVTDLAQKATQWKYGDVVFLDEVHALRIEVLERVYRIMIERKAPQVVETKRGPTINGEVSVPQVTIIAATDQPGLLPNAFGKRFDIEVTLMAYTLKEMIQIIRHSATDNKILLTAQASQLLAKRCRGIPRRAVQFLRLLRHYYGASFLTEYTASHVKVFLSAKGIDHLGRSLEEQYYMDFLNRLGIASLQTIALDLQLNTRCIRKEIEPWLTQQGWLEILPKGRRLTKLGKAVVTPIPEEVQA